MTGPGDTAGVTLGADRLIALRAFVSHPAARVGPVSTLPGGHAIRRRGHGQDLADMREYVAGDDPRHLDPATTARTGTPHIRTSEQERDRTVILVADFRPAMRGGTRRA